LQPPSEVTQGSLSSPPAGGWLFDYIPWKEMEAPQDQ